MSQSRNPLALVLGAAVATGALAGPLFSMDAMAHGYLQDLPKAAAEGKCGEGKCGAGMMGTDKPAKARHEGSCGMAQKDTDKDGRISRAEFAAAHGGKDTMFPKIDTDGDGFISQAEMDAHHASMKKDGKAAGEGKCGDGKCGVGMGGGSM